MTDIDLDAIRARAEASTAGPWKRFETVQCDTFVVNPRGFLGKGGIVCGPTYERDDAEFIAHARTDVPALIAEVERLRRQNANALAEVKRLETEFPCDGGCSPETGGPQEDCSLHGRSPRELWQIFGELQQQRDDVRAENDTLKKRVAAYYYALGVVAKPRTTIGGDVA